MESDHHPSPADEEFNYLDVGEVQRQQQQQGHPETEVAQQATNTENPNATTSTPKAKKLMIKLKLPKDRNQELQQMVAQGVARGAGGHFLDGLQRSISANASNGMQNALPGAVSVPQFRGQTAVQQGQPAATPMLHYKAPTAVMLPTTASSPSLPPLAMAPPAQYPPMATASTMHKPMANAPAMRIATPNAPETVEEMRARIAKIKQERDLVEQQTQQKLLQQQQQQHQLQQDVQRRLEPPRDPRDRPYGAPPIASPYALPNNHPYMQTQYSSNPSSVCYGVPSTTTNYAAPAPQHFVPVQPHHPHPAPGYTSSAMTGNFPAQRPTTENRVRNDMDEQYMTDDYDSDEPLVVSSKRRKAKGLVHSADSVIPPSSPATDKSESSSEIISKIGSWALPQYEIQRQVPESKDGCPSVKVSLPNMVREELLLSTDHQEQEIQMLINLFLPAHQALEVPDPAPAAALLNFHTVAVMVIEAYYLFEIGDESGQGRGHWHGNYSNDDPNFIYPRVRNATDADPDEMFFAVIDRWRAGLESGKESFKLIRGVQEFSDLALDMIFYIKEHGLLRPGWEGRKERSDKGVKRGPKDKGEGEDELDLDAEDLRGKGKQWKQKAAAGGSKTGAKRPGSAKVNTLQASKKAKTAAKQKAQKKSTPGISVVRRR